MRRITPYKFSPGLSSEIKALCRLDNWHAPLAVIMDFAVIALAIVATQGLGWIFYPVALVLIGSRQRALTTIVHEAAHGTLCRSKTLSFVLATVCSGYLIFQTQRAYQASHVAGHHGRFGDPEHDPDYRYMRSKGVYDIRDRKRLTWQLFIKPCLLCNVPSYLGYLVRDRSFSVRGGATNLENVALCAYWLLVMSVALAFGQGLNLLLFWFVPLLTTFQIIGWFIELAEHAPLMENEISLHTTRNRNSHWLELFLTGMHAESYHLAHHLRPRVPFWRLKKLHQILLRDPQYRDWDSRCGGIFFSSNGALSVFSLLRQRCQG